MRRLHYANDVLVTADLVADAVLAYARELANHHSSDTVSIPVLAEDGRIGSTTLLLGPASQIASDELTASEADIAGYDDRFPDPPYFGANAATSGSARPSSEPFDDGSDMAEAFRFLEGV